MTDVINRKQNPQIKNCTYQYLKLCFSKVFLTKRKANRILGKLFTKHTWLRNSSRIYKEHLYLNNKNKTNWCCPNQWTKKKKKPSGQKFEQIKLKFKNFLKMWKNMYPSQALDTRKSNDLCLDFSSSSHLSKFLNLLSHSFLYGP